jgi:hypothetical protein
VETGFQTFEIGEPINSQQVLSPLLPSGTDQVDHLCGGRTPRSALSSDGSIFVGGRPLGNIGRYQLNSPSAICGMNKPPISYKRHRFPPQMIAHAVWLYFRFPLSLRMVEEMWCCHVNRASAFAA